MFFKLLNFVIIFLSDTLDLTSSLLPTSYPSGDPSTFALPVYLAEPTDAFTSRNANAVLECKVAHALKAYFTCNDEIIDDGFNSTELIDPESSSRYVEATLEVTKDQVMDVLGLFTCKCHAASSKGEVVSSEAVVRRACKLFVRIVCTPRIN